MTNDFVDELTLTLRPIGTVRTASKAKFDAPHQPASLGEEVNFIELLSDQQFELALQDLDGFDKVWLVWWFHRNQTWRPRVLPPRGPAARRGVFATRSPHRPCPIGITCVSLHRIEGRVLTVGALDLLDGTPILDIKPYLRTVDAFPEANLGWIEEIEAADRAPAPYIVNTTPAAEEQLAWLSRHWKIDFTERAFAILRRDPFPHRTRRILRIAPDQYRIACGPWRMYYRVEADAVTIKSIGKGISDDDLRALGADKILDRDALIAFAAWQGSSSNP